MNTTISLNVIAEKFVGQANGVYTAIVQLIQHLKEDPEIHLLENGSVAKADLTHSHTIGIEYILKTWSYKHKTIVSAHVVPDSFIGSLIFSELWRPLAKWYLKFAYNRARLIIAVSPMVKQELEKIGVTSRIEVLCNSINRDTFKKDESLRTNLRAKWGIDENEFVVTCVGQIQPRKGIVDFIEAAKQCPSIRFVWVGGRPFGRLTADYAHMTELMANPPANVLFVGIVPLDEMPGYYAMSDVYFMPSYQENFAFATIEAAAIELPLVLRDNIEYPDSLFTHYLKGKTASDFAKIIQALYQDPQYYHTWSKESDALANKYTLSAYMKSLKSLYRSCLD